LFLSSDQDDRIRVIGRLSVDDPLGPGRGSAADLTDGVQFGDEFCSRQKIRHDSERFAAEIFVQSRHDHPHAAVGQILADVDEAPRHELGFVDGDRIWQFRSQMFVNLARFGNRDGFCPPVVV
jgi:hypothetical protein